MRDSEFKQRSRDLLIEEIANLPKRWWYLSFADKEFKGAVLVEAHGLVSALAEANRRGINPGGAVLGFPISPEKHVPAEARNRLLSTDDLIHMFGELQQLELKRSL